MIIIGRLTPKEISEIHLIERGTAYGLLRLANDWDDPSSTY
ncbi:hypothetical protein CaCOL14_003068 [Colletotrichum acutatum]